MRVLLDECLPRRLKHELTDHFVQTVPEIGWAGKQNGELLKLAEGGFDVLLTNDQNLEHQQNLEQFDLAFLVLEATTNDIDDLKPLMPAVKELLLIIKPGQVVHVK